MQSFLQSTRLPARILRPNPLVSSTPRRYASESYGGSQTGHQEVNKDSPNPKADQEHPGPRAPADMRTEAQSGSSSSSGGRPAIYQPGPPSENSDAEVEAHNREMEKRSDRTVNQLHEEDNKVDKNFWSGSSSLPLLVFATCIDPFFPRINRSGILAD
jgi:hypothetical protein